MSSLDQMGPPLSTPPSDSLYLRRFPLPVFLVTVPGSLPRAALDGNQFGSHRESLPPPLPDNVSAPPSPRPDLMIIPPDIRFYLPAGPLDFANTGFSPAG